jgi:uncharacterized protein YjbJ (UPF0337 family)
MDKDRSKGAGKKITGSIKEGIGKVIGNKRLENEGKAEKTEGRAQKGIGKAKDKVRDKLK